MTMNTIMLCRTRILIVIIALVCAASSPTHARARTFGFGANKANANAHEGDGTHQADGETDFYRVLDLQSKREKATINEIRQKYRQLSRRYHPDVAYSAQDKERYSEINRAYEVLSDKRKRKMYDMRGAEGLTLLEKFDSNGGAAAAAAMHPLAHMFGINTDNGLQSPNTTATLEITLEMAYHGGTLKLKNDKEKLCSRCHGRGVEPGTSLDVCDTCRGSGTLTQRFHIAPGMYQHAQVQCPQCGGAGRRARHACSKCHGQKIERGSMEIELTVSPGMPEGHEVVYEMEGNESPDRIPGDLVIVLHTKPHPRFTRRRNGLDLETRLPITLGEALLGFDKTIMHLGEKEKVRVRWNSEADGVVQFGTVMQIKGKGMPKLHVPSERGDLYVLLELSLPPSLTPAQRRAVEDIL